MEPDEDTLPADRDADAPAGPHLVGRERELNRIRAVLEQRQPVLIVVSGEPGAGKTSLLRELQTGYINALWNVVPDGDLNGLRVMPDTTEQSFGVTLLAALGGSIGDSVFSTKHSRSVVARPVEEQLVEHLRSREPVLVLLDNFDPSPDLAGWFVNTFVENIKRSDAEIVVIVAGRPDAVIAVTPYADEFMSLGLLDSQAERSHFRSLMLRLAPKVDEEELEQYVNASLKMPEIVGSLTRVLQLLLPRGSTLGSDVKVE